MFVTVTTDLLIGIASGIALELLLNLWYVGLWHTLRNGSEIAKPNFAVRFLSLFRNPVSQRNSMRAPTTCTWMVPGVFQLVPRDSGARAASADTQAVYLHLSSRVLSSITRQVSPSVIIWRSSAVKTRVRDW